MLCIQIPILGVLVVSVEFLSIVISLYYVAKVIIFSEKIVQNITFINKRVLFVAFMTTFSLLPGMLIFV